jgi:hypothetical protein
VVKLGAGEETRGLLGIKTTIEANLAAVMLDARQAAEKVTKLMTETNAKRKAYYEAPKRLSRLTAEDMAAWWGLRFRTMKEKGDEGKRKAERLEDSFSIKDYWDEALRKVKKQASK